MRGNTKQASFIHMFVYIGGGFIGERTFDFSMFDKLKFSFIDETVFRMLKGFLTHKAPTITVNG